MRRSTLLIGAGAWLVIGGVTASLSNDVLPRPPTPAVSAAALGKDVPTGLVIADQQITAPVDPVGTGERGSLTLPQDATHVGWWYGGATPADPHGTVVIAGHVDDRDGPGALHTAGNLRAGALIKLVTARTTSLYAVVSVTRYPKQALPRTLFTTQGPRQLALITCGGPFNHATGHYRDNIVILARPA